MRFSEITISAQATACGHRLGEVSWPAGSSVLAASEGHKLDRTPRRHRTAPRPATSTARPHRNLTGRHAAANRGATHAPSPARACRRIVDRRSILPHRRQAVASSAMESENPRQGSLRSQASRLVHGEYLQPPDRSADRAWGQRARLARARGQGAQLRPPRRTPVNLLAALGRALPRGSTRRDSVGAQPARQRRGAAASGPTQRGFTAVELADDEKAPVLRAYLKRWKFEVGVFFDGVGPDSSDDELRGSAPKHPCSGWRVALRERGLAADRGWASG